VRKSVVILIVIPLHVVVKFLNRMSSCLRENRQVILILRKGFPPSNLHLNSLPRACGRHARLLQQSCGVWEHEPLAFRSRREEHCALTISHSDSYSVDLQQRKPRREDCIQHLAGGSVRFELQMKYNRLVVHRSILKARDHTSFFK
jgi:glycerol-3-phosphate dehydrogenase